MTSQAWPHWRNKKEAGIQIQSPRKHSAYECEVSTEATPALGVCSCHLCLNACNRSPFARGLSIDFPAYVISHHVRWPIRAPPLITPKRPKANPIHTAAWHTWTRTPPNTFSRLIYPSLAIVPFWFGGIETWLGAVSRTNRIPTSLRC